MAELKATNQAQVPLSATVDDRLQFESLVADVSARFVNLPADQVDAEIEAAQRQIVEALGLDRSTLFELLPDGTLVFTPAVLAGVLTGHWLLVRIPQRFFEHMLLAFAVLAALRLIRS